MGFSPAPVLTFHGMVSYGIIITCPDFVNMTTYYHTFCIYIYLYIYRGRMVESTGDKLCCARQIVLVQGTRGMIDLYCVVLCWGWVRLGKL